MLQHRCVGVILLAKIKPSMRSLHTSSSRRQKRHPDIAKIPLKSASSTPSLTHTYSATLLPPRSPRPPRQKIIFKKIRIFLKTRPILSPAGPLYRGTTFFHRTQTERTPCRPASITPRPTIPTPGNPGEDLEIPNIPGHSRTIRDIATNEAANPSAATGLPHRHPPSSLRPPVPARRGLCVSAPLRLFRLTRGGTCDLLRSNEITILQTLNNHPRRSPILFQRPRIATIPQSSERTLA
jgi:hypothetical protein